MSSTPGASSPGRILRPALTAGAFDAGPRAIAVTRPVIAAHLVAVARMEGATEVAHGASGADRVRFERLIADLAPELTVHATGRRESRRRRPRIDQNLWGRTVTMSGPADPWALAPSDTFTRTSEPHTCAAQPAIVEIAIERGVPVAVNGVPLDIDELVEVVDTIAGDHGVGRFDHAICVRSRAGGSAGRRRAVGRDRRAGVGQLRPRYAGACAARWRRPTGR